MAKSFLGQLTDTLNSQFSVGENQTTNLSSVVNGNTQSYGKLGDYASRIDQTEERKYYEEGYIRNDPYSAKAKQFEILMQEPTATLLIKKRMFSAIAENYRTDFMDSDEKLFYKSMKILFQNKCRQISRLESLSKVQKITENVNDLPETLLQLIIGLSDSESGFGLNIFGGLKSEEAITFNNTLDKLKRIYFFNQSSKLTNWITDDSNLFSTQFGQGTGVIEITNFTNFSTSATLSINNPGTASFSISDPYNAMMINEYDIEKAINDATNLFLNSKFVQFSNESSQQRINNLQYDLNKLREKRGAGNITFNISELTVTGRRVRAIIDAEGVEIPFEYDPGFGGINNLLESPNDIVSVSKEFLINGSAVGINGLNPERIRSNGLNGDSFYSGRYESELSLFKRAVQAIYNQIQITNNIEDNSLNSNINTNYARRKLMFMFLGRNIIQPMDSVHLYVNTKSRYDSRLITGINNMFSGVGVLQNINKSVADLKSAVNSVSMMFGGSGSVDTVAEKNIFVGENFPNWLWSIIRPQFINEKEGTHVFAGLVDRATTDCQAGFYTVNIGATDNSAYLRKGKVNFKPGVDVFNGSLFDPLTPFKTKFDDVNSNIRADQLELLDENIELLANNVDEIPLLKHKSGPNAGQPATQDNILQERKINPNSQLATRTFYAPDGLVYRWKEGIGGTVFSGNSLNIDNVETVGHPTITKDPFAGQDVMNVISLLITGVPYNFRTYWRAVSEFDGFFGDDTSNESPANSYYTSLRNDLKRQNVLWGNFIPFKALTIDESSYKKTLEGLFQTNKINRELENSLKKAQELRKQSFILGAGQQLTDAGVPVEFTANKDIISKELTTITKNINNLITEARDKSKYDYATDYFNSDASNDYGFIDESDDKASNLTRKKLRRKINNLTRRMSYNVRANEDKNLFIVDDFYDKDYDLMAFTKDLESGIDLYRNEFTDVSEKILKAAEVLHLEVFCDTQGHIRVRPPQYNRMPSSVFYNMMNLKQTKGVQIFPQFLVDLFATQIETLATRLGVIEDEIRLLCAVAGINSDSAAHQFINNETTIEGGRFRFLSTDGEITEFDSLTKAANPDVNEQSNVFQSLVNVFTGNNQSNGIASITNSTLFAQLQNQAKTNKAQYSVHQRSQTILDAITKHRLSSNGYHIHNNFTKNFTENSYIDELVSRIEQRTGQKINKYQYIVQNTNGNFDTVSFEELDFFKLTKDLSDKIRERQKIVKLFAGAVNNAIEFRSLDDSPERTRNALIMPDVYGNNEIPETFEHMIEDETYDDYGQGSGARYIIKDAQIIDFSISENAPEYTYVQVRGVLNPYGEVLPPGLNNFPNDGNGLVTADAIDYDTWRMYGFTAPSPITVPFFNNPNTQCLPYAAMLLGRARKNILRGSLTIAGNEYMQQGEVLYIESRGMLFYIEEVRHSYTEGSDFRTTLTLSYGHVPGEYIPVPLDVIGKLMYNNKDLSSYIVQRQSSSFNEEPLGICIMDPQISDPTSVQEYKEQGSNYAALNSKTIAKIMFNASKILDSNNKKGNNVKASIELRIFHDGNPNQDLLSFADSIKTSLTGNITDKLSDIGTTNISKKYSLKSDSVIVKSIDISDSTDYKSATQKAIDAARNVAEQRNYLPNLSETNTKSYRRKNRIRAALFNYVVDCVVKFTEVSKQEANSINLEG